MELLPCFLPDTPAAEAIPAGPRPHPRPYFIFAGRLEVIKGVHEVIAVFRRYTEADLLVAGDGDQAGALSRLAADCPRVRFLGRISFVELNRYYEHAIAQSFPRSASRHSNVLIEAFRPACRSSRAGLGPFPEIIDSPRVASCSQRRRSFAIRRLQRRLSESDWPGTYAAYQAH